MRKLSKSIYFFYQVVQKNKGMDLGTHRNLCLSTFSGVTINHIFGKSPINIDRDEVIFFTRGCCCINGYYTST